MGKIVVQTFATLDGGIDAPPAVLHRRVEADLPQRRRE
jgi:hypothetical protein